MELRAKRPAARLAAALLSLLALLAAAAPAHAQELKFPPDQDKPPPGYERTANQVISIADKQPKVRAERRKRGKLAPTAYLKGPDRWQVSYFQAGRERAQVLIEDDTGWVLEAWTGPQVAWVMARGVPGAFAGRLSAPYLWIPLCVLFVLPFVNFRRPLRMLHLDLLVLLGFGASHYFFNRGEIFESVPLAYPVLLYVLARMLWVGFRPRERREKLVPHFSVVVLAMALVFLVGFRVALNIADSNVIDVGYAGVIGADRIADGRELYEGRFHKDNEHGDTYGPVNYLAYLPFEQAFPFDGTWGTLPAAHGAAIAFDVLTLIGLLLLGRRLRAGPQGTMLGVALAYAWAAYPYTLYTMNSNANDTLVAMLLVYALLALRSPPLRGAFVALGAAAKFAPLALAPLFATASGEQRWRGAALTAVAVVAVLALSFLPFLPDGGVRELYDRTVGYQAGRDSPFSIWGQEPGLDWLLTVVKVLAAGLALLVAFVPRRKTPIQVAALGAAVLVALQLTVSHWFYLYIVWFTPFVLVALFARHVGDDEPPPVPGEQSRAAAREPALA